MNNNTYDGKIQLETVDFEEEEEEELSWPKNQVLQSYVNRLLDQLN